MRRAKALLVAVLELEGDKHWQVLKSLKVLRNSYLPLSTLNAYADFQSFVMLDTVPSETGKVSAAVTMLDVPTCLAEIA